MPRKQLQEGVNARPVSITLPESDIWFLVGLAAELAATVAWPDDWQTRRANTSEAVRTLIQAERKRREHDGVVVFKVGELAGGVPLVRKYDVKQGKLGELTTGPEPSKKKRKR